MLNQIESNPNKKCQTTAFPKGWLDPAGNFHDMGKDAHVSWLQKHLGKTGGNAQDWDAMMNEAYGLGWVRVGGSGRMSLFYGSDIAITNAQRYIEDNIPKDMKVIVDLEDRGHKLINFVSAEAWNGNLKSVVDFQLQNTRQVYFHGWVSPDGKWFPAVLHSNWIDYNADLLKKDYGVNIDLQKQHHPDIDLVDYLLGEGWIRVASGGFQFRKNDSVKILNEFILENQNVLQDEIYVDAPSGLENSKRKML